MFDYRKFLMTGFRSAVGHMADYQVILNANGYYEKGVLTEDDLSELQATIEEKNAATIEESLEVMENVSE